MKNLSYPPTRREELKDTTGGITFENPYRWLEEDTGEVLEWERVQSEFTSGLLRGVPGYEALYETLAAGVGAQGFGRYFPTQKRGDHWLRVVGRGWGNRLEIADSAEGPWDKLVDATEVDDSFGLFGIYPSPDGKYITLHLTEGSVFRGTILIIDTDARQVLPERMRFGSTYGATWLHDSSGFYFTHPHAGRSGAHQVFFHRMGERFPPEPEDIEIVGDHANVAVSKDDRYAFIFDSGWEPKIALFTDRQSDGGWKPFLPDDYEGLCAGQVVGDVLIARSADKAPRGKIVSIPLATSRDRSTWTELVAETDAVLRTMSVLGERMVTSELVDMVPRVRVFGLEGNLLHSVSLDEPGVIGPPTPAQGSDPDDPPTLIVSHSTPASVVVYNLDLATGELTEKARPFDVPDMVVKRVEATSQDGTPVHIFIQYLKSTDVSSPRPLLIHAYGGFNQSPTPAYHGDQLPFLKAGGVYAQFVLRGDSTFGRDHWLNGCRLNKQNSYDDFRAAAEYLIANGWSTPDQMGFWGASNGGLLAGVAATQCHDLFKVIVSRVGPLDMMHYHRDHELGVGCGSEWGDPEDPAFAEVLFGYSPYHNVIDGTAYPAFLAVLGEDDSVHPWHGRKMVARLREASSSDEPILLRIWLNTGHWAGSSLGGEVHEVAEVQAFIFERLGLKLEA